MAEYSAGESSKPLADHDEAQGLTDQAGDKGLVLPSGFILFIRSTEYQYRMASTSAWFFVLEKLIPCPPTVDDGEGGYLMMFHSDQQGCGFAYLYLSPKDGHHCVLFSLTNLYEEEDVAEAVAKEDFALAALTFEEYLVERYYTEILLFRGHGAKGTSSEGLKNFVGAVYRSPREVAHLREHSKLFTKTIMDSTIVPSSASALPAIDTNCFIDEAIQVYLDAIKWQEKNERDQNIISDESSSGEDSEVDDSESEDDSSDD